MIRAVLLDAGGTLFHRVPSTTDVILDVLSRHGLAAPRLDVHRAFHLAIHNEGVPEPGAEAAAWRRVNLEVLEHMGVAPTEGLVADLSHALEHQERALYPDVLPALDALEASGLRVAVVSNFTHSLPRILDELGIASRFDAVVYSWKAGFAKPDPRIYRAALDALRVAPGEAAMAGDSEAHDVAGAIAVGIRGFLLDREREPGPGRIRDLRELPARVSSPKP